MPLTILIRKYVFINIKKEEVLQDKVSRNIT